MQILIDARAIASYIRKRLGKGKAIGHKHVDAVIATLHPRSVHTCHDLAGLSRCTARDTRNVGYLLARRIDHDVPCVNRHHAVCNPLKIARDMA